MTAETPASTPDDPALGLPPVEPPSAGFIVQLFVIPAIIVAVVVAVWLLFGKLAGGERDAMVYVEALKSPDANWRSAFELASLIHNDKKVSTDPRILGELARLLDQDLDPRPDGSRVDETLVQYLTIALGEFQTLAGTAASGEPVDVVAVLGKALDDSRTTEVRIAASASLAKLAARQDETLVDPRAVAALAATRSSDAAELRKIAAFALGFLGGPEAAAALRATLDDPDADVRYNAAVALGRRGDLAALGTFREMLSPEALATRLEPLPEAERGNRAEAITVAALGSLETGLKRSHPELPRALRPELDALGRSGLVAVRSRAREILKSLPADG